MTDLATLGIAVDSSAVKGGQNDLRDFREEAKRTEQQINATATAMAKGKPGAQAYAEGLRSANAQSGEFSKGTNKVIESLNNQFVRMNTNARQYAIIQNVQKAGVELTSREGAHIAKMTGALYDMEQAHKKVAAANDNSNRSASNFINTLTRRLVFAAVVSQLKEMAKAVFELNTELAKTGDIAARNGLGGASTQGLLGAAAGKGVDTDKMLDGMLQFNAQVNLAKSGLGSLAPLFKANGIAASDTKDSFLQIADLVARSSNDYSKQVSILTQAGLPATREMVRFMEQGRASIVAQSDATKKFSQTQLDEAQRLDDRWNKFWEDQKRVGKSAILDIFNTDNWKVTITPGSPIDKLIQLMKTPGAGMGGAYKAPPADPNRDFIPGMGTGPSSVTRGSDLAAPKAAPAVIDPEKQKQLISLSQQRLSVLGPLLSVEQQVKQKELELAAAGLNLYGVNSKQREALLNLARAQAELNQIQAQASAGVFDLGKNTAQAGHELQGWIDRKLLDPANVEQMAGALQVLAKRIEQTSDAAKVARAPLEGLQRLANDAGSMRGQLDTLSTTTLNGLSDGLVSIANGSATAGDAFRSFGMTVVTALQKMIIQLVIIAPLAKALQGFFGFGLFSDGGYVDPGSSSNPLAGLTSADYGPGFASGGFTGAGGKYQPAGIVHAGEYVFDAVSTSRIGVRNLDAMRSVVRGYDVGGFVTAPATPSFGGNVVAGPWGQQDNAAPSFTYAPQIDARGADAAAVARLAAVMAKDKRDFEKNVQSVMIKYRANNPGANR